MELDKFDTTWDDCRNLAAQNVFAVINVAN